MRIVVYPHNDVSGIDTYTRGLAAELAERGHEVHAIVWHQLPRESGLLPFKLRRLATRLSQIVADIEPDVVHCATNVPSFLDVSPPVVGTAWFHPPNLFGALYMALRQDDELNPGTALRVVQRAANHHYDTKAYDHAAVTVGVTKPLARALERNGYRAEYIPPGIDRGYLPDSRPEYPDNNPIELAFVATNVDDPRKGFDKLVEAISVLESEHDTSVRLHVVGDAGQEVRRSRLRSDVTFHGFCSREEVFSIVTSTNAYVAPSLYEEFGYMILEALARGVPVVASETHAFEDILRDGGGEICDIRSPVEFAEGIVRVATDEDSWNECSREALDVVERRYTLDTVGEQIESLYHSVIA
jgi:glycosyltransferase involved in cell wall biosynthesis